MTNMIESCAMVDRQQQFARSMRAQPTDAERVLWQRLRHDIALTGSHFRRQALIGPFIVDFASHKAKLVIELDGGQHDLQRDADDRRTRQIEARGYCVLRFWNNDVLGNLEGVLETIQSALTPTPDPSREMHQGAGERLSLAEKITDDNLPQCSPCAFCTPPPAGRDRGWGYEKVNVQ